MTTRSGTTGRREPPPFRLAALESIEILGPRMVRILLTGNGLAEMVVDQPAASVRLLLAHPGERLEIPTWNGNEFLLGDARRPIIRTFTPRYLDGPRLTIDLVKHTGGAASQWVESAHPGDRVAVSGPGRGYTIDPSATQFVLAGDETAIPAIGQLMEALPPEIPINVHLVVDEGFGTVVLPPHPRGEVSWHVSKRNPKRAILAALEAQRDLTTSQIWCAGEAADMHAVRKYLFEECGVPRRHATVRGYWKTKRRAEA